MVKRNWVENAIFGIIVFNVFVLVYVFLIPRAQFIIGHWELGPEALMETPGPMDLPNQYPKTYKVANQIRRVTKEDVIILMPTDNWEFGENRSPVIQRLYPRKVYFFGDADFYDHKNSVDSKTTVYAVGFSGDSSNLCFKRNIKSLGETNFVLCELKN
ncbi:MAG: hypothetical protein VX579_02810 [Nitrospinota bacterium]|nr:hypothetical protein [Nitrospinota bacterium]